MNKTITFICEAHRGTFHDLLFSMYFDIEILHMHPWPQSLIPSTRSLWKAGEVLASSYRVELWVKTGSGNEAVPCSRWDILKKQNPSMIRHLRKSHLEARKDWTQVMLLGEAVCVQGSIAACLVTLTRPCFYHSSRVVFVQSTLIWLVFSVIFFFNGQQENIRVWLWVTSQLPVTLKFARY